MWKPFSVFVGDCDRRERLDENNMMKIVVRFRSVERRPKASSASGCTIATKPARRKPVLWGIRQTLGPPKWTMGVFSVFSNRLFGFAALGGALFVNPLQRGPKPRSQASPELVSENRRNLCTGSKNHGLPLEKHWNQSTERLNVTGGTWPSWGMVKIIISDYPILDS